MPITFDPTKRFATAIPILCADGRTIGIFSIMGGKPSQTEINKYPNDIGFVCNKKKYCDAYAWLQCAKYYKRRTKRSGHRICYVDNYGVHVKHQPEFDTITKYSTRYLIKNSTSKMQPVDQHCGKYIQDTIKRDFYLLSRDYTNKIKRGKNPKQKKLGDMRIWLMWELHKCLVDMNKNRVHLVQASWTNTGLFLPVDGSKDGFDERRMIEEDEDTTSSESDGDNVNSDDNDYDEVDDEDEKLNDE